jgi:ABC-type lipopolysaccharide export system ATPase subunit
MSVHCINNDILHKRCHERERTNVQRLSRTLNIQRETTVRHNITNHKKITTQMKYKNNTEAIFGNMIF